MTRTTAIAALAIAAAGFAIALLALPHSAFAWDYGNLPAGCSKGPTLEDTSGPSYSYAVICNGVSSGFIHYGSNPYPYPPTDATFQGNLDAFVDAHYTAPATTTTTTSTGASTTPTPTTTATTTDTTATTTTVTQTVTTASATPTATPPTASFTSTATGLAVTFTDTSTAVAPATISTVTWHYGDGANGVGATSTHTFTSSGDFTVVEIVTDSNGLASQASETITLALNIGTPSVAEVHSPSLSAAATATFGQPLGVLCVTSWGRLKAEGGQGAAFISSHVANIWAAGCRALTLKRGPVALALLVLGHESAHALGIKSEKTADCYGLRKLPVLERALGITDHGYRATEARYVHRKWGRC